MNSAYKGLLYKDLFHLRGSFAVVAVLFLVMTLILGIGGGVFALYVMLMVLAVKMIESTLIYDETEQWDSFVLTTPVSRSVVIRSKYLLQIIFIAAASFLASVVFLLFTLFIPAFAGDAVIYQMLILGFGYSLVYSSVIIPLYLKVGAEKSRIISFAVLILVAAVYALTVGTLVFSESVVVVFCGTAVVSFAAFGASYMLSQKIYAKKEF